MKITPNDIDANEQVLDPEERTSSIDSGPVADTDEVKLNEKAPGSDVSASMLADDIDRSDSWLHYNKGHEQIGFSPATRLTTDNVSSLSQAYTIDVVKELGNCAGQAMEANPIIVPSDPPVMYITQGNMHVNALNARTGEGFWKFKYGIEGVENSGVRNRGVAVWKDKVYYAVPDETDVYPRLIALNRYTGEKQWETNLMLDDQMNSAAHLEKRIYISQAPLVFDDHVIIGQSGDKGGWTYVQAFDAESGDRVWKHRTAPKNEWVEDSWRFSSSASWMSPAVDPESGTAFFSITNPDPMLNPVVRPGPNKHSESIMAVDVKSGDIQWTNQLLPHELWDYDVHTTPFVFDMKVAGESRRVVAQAGKVGWCYVLDAETGQLLERSRPFAKQDHWGEGFLNLPPAGKENAKPIWPSLNGAKEWLPEAYSPQTGLAYVGSNKCVQTISYDPDWAYNPDSGFEGFMTGGSTGYPEEGETSTAVAAINPASGEIVWKHELADFHPDSPAAFQFTGGTTATAGNLVFHGSAGGHLVALNAETGEKVWQDDTGSRITAQPIVWDDPAVGKQYVATASNDKIVVYSAKASSNGKQSTEASQGGNGKAKTGNGKAKTGSGNQMG